MFFNFDISFIFWLLAIFPGSSFVTLLVLYLFHFVRGEQELFFNDVSLKGFLYVWFFRPIFSIGIGIIFYMVLVALSVPAILPIPSIFWQFAILYIAFELSIYVFHFITHKYSIFSFLHTEHHEIKKTSLDK